MKLPNKNYKSSMPLTCLNVWFVTDFTHCVLFQKNGLVRRKFTTGHTTLSMKFGSSEPPTAMGLNVYCMVI